MEFLCQVDMHELCKSTVFQIYKRLVLNRCSRSAVHTSSADLTKNCGLASAPPPLHKPFSLNDMPNHQPAIKRRHIQGLSKHLLELSMAEAEVMTMEWGGYLCLSLRITSIFGKSFIDLDRGEGRLYQHQHRETH